MVFTCVVAGALVLLFTRLPLGARTRRLLTPLAAQHRLTRLDEDSNDWEQAFAGELLWLATRGVLRIQEVDDAGPHAGSRMLATALRVSAVGKSNGGATTNCSPPGHRR